MIDLFNKELTQLSHRLTSRRLIQQQLQHFPELVFQELRLRDKQSKGYLTHSEVISLFIAPRLQPSKTVLDYLAQTFPFPEISYSALIDIMMGLPSSQTQLNALTQEEIGLKMEEILIHQVQIFQNTTLVQEKISQFVPSAYFKPTKKQFYQYVACQQLGVDIEALAKALRLPDLPPPKEKMVGSEEWAPSLPGPGVVNLQKMMTRLKERVSKFGSGWIE